jgi:hypothetical protein
MLSVTPPVHREPDASRTISASDIENSYPPRLAIDFGE